MVNMKRTIAERKLLYSPKGSDVRKEFLIRVDAPYIVDPSKVDFSVGETPVIGCHIETEGLEEEYLHEMYGVDEFQAVDIAIDIDPFLKRLSKKYDLYWPDGESYF